MSLRETEPQGLFDNPKIMDAYQRLRREAAESEKTAGIIRRIEGAGLIMVIDPEKAFYDLEDTLKRIEIAARMGMKVILIGGSTDKKNEAGIVIPEVSRVIKRVERDTLVAAFPGTSSQVVESIDATFSLFLPQLDSVYRANPKAGEFLTGEYFKVIERSRQLGVPVIPVTYVLFNCGKPTSVEIATGIDAINVQNGVDVERNMKTIRPWLKHGGLVMLEAGSRPETSVNLGPVAEEVYKQTQVLPIVTGGIKSVELIRLITRNYPFPVVFGSVAEQTPPDYFGMLYREFMESHPLCRNRYQ